ncbi:MAG: tetratricopeptide repeat protein [Bacteroidota bacterium]
MLKTRIILALGAAVLVYLLFLLPKSVVDNDKEQIAGSNSKQEAAEDPHSADISEENRGLINELNDQFANGDDFEKNLTFADSLARLYISLNKYDSAAKFFEMIAERVPNLENWIIAADTYYEAFGFAMDAGKRSAMAEKARFYFDKVLEEQPDNTAVKNKVAMTLVSSSNPMQGILMLREILQQDPDNEEATFNLGVLSMQSGQYEKAVERFESLILLYPENTQARFFLGVSYLEIGSKEKAKEQLLLVKSMDDDPAVQATVDSYLEDM